MGFDPSRIPHGFYCYASLSPMDDRGLMRVNGLCPYWERRGEDSAFCHYLGEEDTILLWDQCKICGINDECDSDRYPEGGDGEAAPCGA